MISVQQGCVAVTNCLFQISHRPSFICPASKPEGSEETLRNTKEVQRKAEEKYKVLENKMKNAEAEREKELKAAQEKLNAAKSKADAFNKKMKQKQQVRLPDVGVLARLGRQAADGCTRVSLAGV